MSGTASSKWHPQTHLWPEVDFSITHWRKYTSLSSATYSEGQSLSFLVRCLQIAYLYLSAFQSFNALALRKKPCYLSHRQWPLKRIWWKSSEGLTSLSLSLHRQDVEKLGIGFQFCSFEGGRDLLASPLASPGMLPISHHSRLRQPALCTPGDPEGQRTWWENRAWIHTCNRW